jgi:hypothetical protein
VGHNPKHLPSSTNILIGTSTTANSVQDVDVEPSQSTYPELEEGEIEEFDEDQRRFIR